MINPARDGNTHVHLERISCDLCKADDPELLFREGQLDLVRCKNCSLVYVSPRLMEQQVRELYDQEYFHAKDEFTKGTRIYRGGYRDYIGDQEYYYRTFQRRMDDIETYLQRPGRVLDVGCAAGFFLYIARQRGWQVEGVELSNYVADYATIQLGIKVYLGSLEDVRLEGEAYDLVTVWDTLEHISAPTQTLSKIYTLLKPEGLLVLSTQNIDSLIAIILGTRWPQMGNHLNLYHFSPRTIRILLSNSGFHDLYITWKGKLSPSIFIEMKGKYKTKSLRRLAREYGANRETVRRVLKTSGCEYRLKRQVSM